ncbi:hypothetical protein BHM03_00049331 [Ensete ventricosum]|nr:hypothetical protein BHM03_00049331 [Ensete ventricosum]
MIEKWLVEARLSPASRGAIDLNVLRKKPRMPGGKSAPTAGPESAQPAVEVVHMEASAKRPIGTLEFDRGVLHPTLAKNLYTLPLEVLIVRAAKQIVLGHHYQMALLDRVHDSGRLVTHMGNRASLLKVELEKLKTERDPEQLTRARQRVDELEANNAS